MTTFTPRPFQEAFCDALENKGYRKLIAVWPRRSGKDVMCWNLVIRMALRKIGVYMYCLPTFSQARKVIWDSITNDSSSFLSFIPSELVKSMNGSELKITLVNGSIIQLIGSDSYDTALVGTNPRCVVFSEFALADADALKFVSPILNANGGTLMIISTPRGKNALWDVYQNAKDSPDWFCQKLSLDDTNHIPLSMIQQDIQDGLVSEELVQQEYYCSFEQGHEGAYYAKYIDRMRNNGQIGPVNHNPMYRTFTAWDIGVKDYMAIIFFQLIGPNVHVIDCYQNTGLGIDHYIDVLRSKPYKYDKHWGPADIAVREVNTGYSRVEAARQLGLNFEIKDNGLSSALPNIGFANGINAARAAMAITYIDEYKCADLIKALENYRESKNKFGIGTGKDVHDKYSHLSDAFRYMSVSLDLSRAEFSSPEELERRYIAACNYGKSDNPYAPVNNFNSISNKYSRF